MFNFLKMKQEESVESLLNKLIIKLKEEGKSIALPTIADNFGSLTVFAHDIGTEDAFLEINGDDWEIKVKPYFKEF